MSLFEELYGTNPCTIQEVYEEIKTTTQQRRRGGKKQVNNNLKQENMNLQNLKEGKTTKFNAFIKPVKPIIEKEYGELLRENANQVNYSILVDVLMEVRENKGVLAYITDQNKLSVEIDLLNKYNIHNTKSLDSYYGSITMDKGYNGENEDVIKDLYLNTSNSYDGIDSLYYISDEKALVDFYNKEQAELLAERQKEEQEKLEKRQQEDKEKADKKEEILNKTIEYGLDEVDSQLISKLDAIKELGVFGDKDPKEVLKTLEILGMGTYKKQRGFDVDDYYDYICDIARDIATDIVDDHECSEH